MSAGQDAPITAVDPVSSGEASNTEAPQQSVVLLQPNATLYVSNIDWSIKKNILRRALLALFERHGKVREIFVKLDSFAQSHISCDLFQIDCDKKAPFTEFFVREPYNTGSNLRV